MKPIPRVSSCAPIRHLPVATFPGFIKAVLTKRDRFALSFRKYAAFRRYEVANSL